MHSTLYKFIKERDNLNIILDSQRISKNKIGLDYKPKSNDNFF